MFRNHNNSQDQSIRTQRTFFTLLNKACQQPFVSSSDQVLEDSLTILDLYPQATARMPGRVTKDILRECEEASHYAIYHLSLPVIDSPTFNNLISSLQLTVEKAQLLSMRKLGSLLTSEIAAITNQTPIPPASPTSVALLFERLNNIGISFEALASVEDKKFELFVSGANQLLKLSDEDVPLNKLLDLSYIQTWALTIPPAVNEHELIKTTREQAKHILNTHDHNLGNKI